MSNDDDDDETLTWNLATPEWNEPLVKARGSFSADELGEAIGEALGEAGLSLDADLDSLKGAEGNVSDDFSGGRACEEDEGLVLGSIFRASNVRVVLLEEFVEAELAGSLRAVSEQRRHPSPEEAFHSLLP